ncbi:MAG TPA: CsgG/HfaB family protein [Gemmatimonadaceae bacterium]|nr:CsgG/HfaB family protein [Gemmatimonadaceae bacterium]
MSARTSMKAWVAAALLIGAPALAVAQANNPVVAVLYFDNNSFGKDRADYDGLGKGIADLLINDMASNASMRVVERDRIQSILQEQSLVQTKSIDPQTAVRLGKLLGAQYMITGGFMSDGKGTLLVTSRVISVETGAITNPVKLQSKGDDVLGLIGELSTKLNTELKLPALTRTGATEQKKPVEVGANAGGAKQSGHQAPATRVASAKPQKLDVKTALLYSKALDEQDNGNPQKAAELYRAVLQRFPDFGPAQQNLAKVQKSGH